MAERHRYGSRARRATQQVGGRGFDRPPFRCRLACDAASGADHVPVLQSSLKSAPSVALQWRASCCLCETLFVHANVYSRAPLHSRALHPRDQNFTNVICLKGKVWAGLGPPLSLSDRMEEESRSVL